MSYRRTGRPTGVTRAAGRRNAENRARLLDAGRAVFARTGLPPTLSQLAAESGLSRGQADIARRKAAADGAWPWPVRPSGDWRPRDESGLTPRQAEWLAAFRRGPSVSLAALAREFGTHPSVAWDFYRRLRAGGIDLPPLARPRRPREAPGREPEAAAGPEEVARRLAIVRKLRAEIRASGRPLTHEQYHALLDERLGDRAGVTVGRRRGA